MRALLSRGRRAVAAAWAREPVLIGTVLPVLVTVGALTAVQANAITAAAAVTVQVLAAFGIRSSVHPAKPAAPVVKP